MCSTTLFARFTLHQLFLSFLSLKKMRFWPFDSAKRLSATKLCYLFPSFKSRNIEYPCKWCTTYVLPVAEKIIELVVPAQKHFTKCSPKFSDLRAFRTSPRCGIWHRFSWNEDDYDRFMLRLSNVLPPSWPLLWLLFLIFAWSSRCWV